MSDTQAAMREFRFLDEKRKTNGLTQAEEQRWQELGTSLGMETAAPAPQGYYGPDGQWYQYPPGYDPATGQYAYPPQGYQPYPYGYPPPQYDPNTGQYYAPQPQFDPATGQYYAPQPQQWPQPQGEGQPAWGNQWEQPPVDGQPAALTEPSAPGTEPPPESLPPESLPPEPLPSEAPGELPPSAAASEYTLPEPVQALAPVPSPGMEPRRPATPPPAPAPAPRAEDEVPLEVSSDEVMEVRDDEVSPIPTAPPPSAPTKKPAPLPIPLSDDPVAELRNALSLDEDLGGDSLEPLIRPSSPVPARPVASVAPPPVREPEPEPELPKLSDRPMRDFMKTVPHLEVSALEVPHEPVPEPPAPEPATGAVQARAWEPVPSTKPVLAPAATLPELESLAQDEPTTALNELPPPSPPVATPRETPLAVAPTPLDDTGEEDTDPGKTAPHAIDEPSVVIEELPSVMVDDQLTRPTDRLPALVRTETPTQTTAATTPEPEPEPEPEPAPSVVREPDAAPAGAHASGPEEVTVPGIGLETAPPAASAVSFASALDDIPMVDEPPASSASFSITEQEIPVEAAAVEPTPEPPALEASVVEGVVEAIEPPVVAPAAPPAVEPESHAPSLLDSIAIAPEVPVAQPELPMMELDADVVVGETATLATSWEAPTAANEAAPQAQPAPAKQGDVIFASSWDPEDTTLELTAPASSFDDARVAPELAGKPDDQVELAGTADFLNYSSNDSAVAVEMVPDTDDSPFEVDSTPLASVATNMTGVEGSADGAGERLELASNSDFLDNPKLTQTGEAWQSPESSAAIVLEAEVEGEIIQGVVVEEESPQVVASWDVPKQAAPAAAPWEDVPDLVTPSAVRSPTQRFPAAHVSSPSGLSAVPAPVAAPVSSQSGLRAAPAAAPVSSQSGLRAAPAAVPESSPSGALGAPWGTRPSSGPLTPAPEPVAPVWPPPGPLPQPPQADWPPPGVASPNSGSSSPSWQPVSAQPPIRGVQVPPLQAQPPEPVRVAVATATQPAQPSVAPQPPVQSMLNPVSSPSPQVPVNKDELFDRGGLVPRAEDRAPIVVSGEHRVILHTMEGQVKRGALREANLAGDTIALENTSGANENIPQMRVKAIFFMLAPGSRAPTADGQKVRVTFKDGRQVAGFSRDHGKGGAGFFVVPADNRTNTERIFIFRHSVQAVLVES